MVNRLRAYVKPPRKCRNSKSRETRRNGDKSCCLSRPPHDIKQLIRQALLASGWTQEPAFDGYAEEYLW